jgi:hypothetical protein
MDYLKLLTEIINKVLTIATTQGGLDWLSEFFEGNARFQERLDAAVAQKLRDAPDPRLKPGGLL